MLLQNSGGKLLNSIKVFDLYKDSSLGENKKSLAFNLYFEDPNKTLTLEEVTLVFDKIIEEVEKKYNCTLRNS